MSEDILNQEISVVIKERAKSLGITQAKLASELDVSLATIKRWYGGRGLTLGAIQLLCNQLSLTLTDLFLTIEKGNKEFLYTHKQEAELARKPELLALLDYIIRGWNIGKIKRKFGISENKMTKSLLELDRLKLIELHENNKIKLLIDGEPVWRSNGPLRHKFKKEILNDYLGSLKDRETSFYLHDYLKEDMFKIEEKIKELKDLLVYCHKRAQKGDDKSSYGTHLSFCEFSWDMDKYL